MEFIEKAIESIKGHEGFSEMPYLDSRGFATIGYGRRLYPKVGEGKNPDAFIDPPKGVTTREEEDRWLLKYVGDLHRELANEFQYNKFQYSAAYLGRLSDQRKAVILEMAYQLGTGGCGDFRRMWGWIYESEWQMAASAMLDSKWRGQTPSRCAALAARMLVDSYA